MIKSCKIEACANGMLGLHLSRAPWDPYPWISGVQKDSNAQRANLHMGDTVLELNGQNILGKKISEIAEQIHEHWRSGAKFLIMTIWRNCNSDETEDKEKQHNTINQQSLQKFATCLQHIAQLLECPVCLEVIKPPGWQCCNGHVLCTNCRSRSEKCPVCRVPLGPRGRCLLSDKLFTLLAESFPCDGVRNSKGSFKEEHKCTAEFHNQPKMAITNTLTPSTNSNNNNNLSATTTTTTAAKIMTAKVRAKREEIKAKEIMKKVKSLNTPNNNNNQNNNHNNVMNQEAGDSQAVATVAIATSTRRRDVEEVDSKETVEFEEAAEAVDKDAVHGLYKEIIEAQIVHQRPSTVFQRELFSSQENQENKKEEIVLVGKEQKLKEHAKISSFMRNTEICNYNNNNNNNNNNRNLLNHFYNKNNIRDSTTS